MMSPLSLSDSPALFFFFFRIIIIFGLPCTLGSTSRNLGSEVSSDADESALK